MNKKPDMPKEKYHVMLVAGEKSGDFLGAELMNALKKLPALQEKEIVFSGVGGPGMIEEGLQSLFPMAELSVMGLTEVLGSLPNILKRMRHVIRSALDVRPDVLVTIDSPDFGLRVAKAVKKKNPSIRCVHYVAPTVWAWREGRAKAMSKYLDSVLCLFPFEPEYFQKHGLDAQFVGHPLTEKIPVFTHRDKESFYQQAGLKKDKPILCVLPGSRRGEILRLLPVFEQTCQILKQHVPDLQIIIPTLPEYTIDIETVFLPLRGKVIVGITDKDKYLAFASSTAALHASGTVALELALCGTPMVTAYKVSYITGKIGRYMLKTPFVNLVNILMKKPLIKERLQDDCMPSILADDLVPLLDDPHYQNSQKEQITNIRGVLQAQESFPGQAAALHVAQYMNPSHI